MKKITLLMLFFSTLLGHSQIRNYTFSQSTDTYQEIANTGSVILGGTATDNEYFTDPTNLAGNTGITSGNGFPIGFDFVFNGTTYNQFGVSANGWISLGSTSFSPKQVDLTINGALANTPLSSTSSNVTDALCSRIAALANDIQAQAGSSLLYKVTGTAPNRVLVVQWKGYKKTTNGDGDSFSFQIRLSETTNAVQVVYGNFQSNITQTKVQVGLRGEPAIALTNFNERTSSSAWSNSSAGAATADLMILSNGNLPTSGLTFTWTPNTCGAVKTLTATNISSNSATLTWTSYTPTPAGFEYTYSKDSTLPLGSGIAGTNNTANISGLDPNSVYNVFFRTKCGTQYTPWFLTTTFKTRCSDQSAFYETFDFYAPYGTFVMPDCWDKVLLGSQSYVNIDNGNNIPGSAYSSPNRLSISAYKAVSNIGYAILPSISNLHDNTNRLRFKAIATSANQTLTLGYLTSGTDVSTFQPITTFTPPSTSTTTTYQEFTYDPGALPVGVTRLAFKVGGVLQSSSVQTVYLDDVAWEPKPKCDDVSNVQASGVTPDSATVTWTPAAGNTKWQYVYSAVTSEINPFNLTPIDVYGDATSTIPDLQAGTNYRVWVRSNCNGSDSGDWIGPVSFTTLCALEDMLFENFDASTDLPSCWKKVGTAGTAVINTDYPPLAPSNTLKLSGAGTGAVVSLKPLSNASAGTHRLKFMARTSTAGAVLELGYLTDANDASTFHKLQDVTVNSTSNYEPKQFFLGNSPLSNYLAFRAVTNDLYIDNVIWEPIPDCADINTIAAGNVNSNSAILNWNAGGSESNWQYALGAITDTNPYNLEAKNFSAASQVQGAVTGTILGLTPNSTYKVWIKAVCGNSGAYIGPYILKTSCSPVTDFTQNFDAATSMPSCWSVSGLGSYISVTNSTNTSLSTPPYLLALAGQKGYPAVVAMPAVSNSADGTHRLTFKYSASGSGVQLEVGYLKNIADNSTFVPLGNIFTCTTTVQFGIADLGFDPASEILAFRVKGGIVYLDDVVWSAGSGCTDISGLSVNSVTDSSIGFSWTGGGQETKWQYVVGTAADTDPTTLTPFNITNGQPNTIASQLATNQPILPNTFYKIWVRSKCPTSLGTWVGPVSATTTCAPANSFYEDFNAGVLPTCWRRIGTLGKLNVTSQSGGDFNDTKLYLENKLNDMPMVALPALDLSSFADHILKFKLVGTANLEVGYLTNISDPSSFVTVKSYTPSSTTVADIITLNFGNSPVSNVIAMRLTNTGGCFVDNVSWNKIPATTPNCAQATTSPANSCGNPEIILNWQSVDGADGYLLDVGTQSGNYNLISGKNLGDALTTSFRGNAGMTYYYNIRPFNYLGASTSCIAQTVIVANNNCYCISTPTLVDGFGIVNIELGDINFAVSNPYAKIPYKDFTDKPVNIVPGAQTNLQLTFFTQNSHKYAAWIDLNDDYNFDDQTEKFAMGISEPCIYDPFLADVSFTMPANAKLGKHRMRVVGKAGTEDAYPCYSGSLGETVELTVNVTTNIPTPPSNDEPVGAVSLTVGNSFNSNAINGSNVNATGSYKVETPECGNYFSSDVWYKAVVPASGKLIFEVNGVTGGLMNGSGAVYSGTPDNLKLIYCDGIFTDTEYNPKATVTGRIQGETIYFRVWENGGDTFGAFKVSAYDNTNTALGTDNFEMENFMFYPNPVKDVLNLSLNTEISNVTITNLLGQTVISKSINANKGTIDMSALSAGTYLVKVTAGNQLKTIKIIKE